MADQSLYNVSGPSLSSGADAVEADDDFLPQSSFESAISERFSTRTPRIRSKGNGKYRRSGVEYASAGEVALSMLMEDGISSFKAESATSVQVPISELHTSDFLVERNLVEYHPMIPLAEFKRRTDYIEWRRRRDSLDGSAREEFERQSKDELAERYYERRKAIIDASEQWRGTPLIVARNPLEFYDAVYAPLAGEGGLSKVEFMKAYDYIIDSITIHSLPNYRKAEQRYAA